MVAAPRSVSQLWLLVLAFLALAGLALAQTDVPSDPPATQAPPPTTQAPPPTTQPPPPTTRAPPPPTQSPPAPTRPPVVTSVEPSASPAPSAVVPSSAIPSSSPTSPVSPVSPVPSVPPTATGGPSPTESGSSSGSNTSAIIGGVVGGLVVIAGGAFFVVSRSRNTKARQSPAGSTVLSPETVIPVGKASPRSNNGGSGSSSSIKGAVPRGAPVQMPQYQPQNIAAAPQPRSPAAAASAVAVGAGVAVASASASSYRTGQIVEERPMTDAELEAIVTGRNNYDAFYARGGQAGEHDDDEDDLEDADVTLARRAPVVMPAGVMVLGGTGDVEEEEHDVQNVAK